jgi:acetyltransferase-like isoleucine patch superfamily enzyme
LHIVVVACSLPLHPFGVCVDECPLGDSSFGAVRDRNLKSLGLTPPPAKAAPSTSVTGPALVMADDVWVTRRALGAFLRVTKTAATTTTLGLPPSRLVELMSPLQDLPAGGGFPCAFVPAGVTTTAAQALAAPPTLIAYREIPVSLPVPRHLLGRSESTTTWPLTSTVALRVRHWLHVLRASHLAPQVWLLEHAQANPLRSALRLAMGLRPTAAGRYAAWKRAFVFRGKNTHIHKSAVVEGSVIGDNVTIGPHALVLQSIIGDGVVIEQRAHVSQSTLGAGTFVSLNSSLQACVSFGDSDACANNLQTCVIGKGVGLTSFARALDTVVGGAVRVDDNGVLREVGELPCGVAFGEGVYVGAGVTIAAGRAIPAGVRIVGGDHILRRVGEVAAGTFVVDDGALRALV